mgnify:CR=1 FL=1
MKTVALVAAALFATQAFAQLPPLPIPLPTLPPLPAPALPALGGSAAVVVNGTGVIVTVDSTQTPPVAVTPVGLPPLPGLPGLP